MILDPVTVRWAGALYGLAQRKSALAAVVADVGRIQATLRQPELARRIANPRIARAERRAALEPALAGAHQLTRNFVDLCFERGREAVLLSLAAAFHRRTLEEQNQVEGVVESARPVDDALLKGLARSIGARLGKELLLTNRVVPELVGGVRVIAGNRMLDASLKGRLDGLRRNLLEAPLGARNTEGKSQRGTN